MNVLKAIIILLVLDFLWISLYMGREYGKMIPRIQGSPMVPNLLYALIAYTLMVLGLIHFVLPNVRQETLFKDSLLYGLTFGIIVYGIFDFTNAAVLKDWDMRLALIDVAWGGFVYFSAVYFSNLKILC